MKQSSKLLLITILLVIGLNRCLIGTALHINTEILFSHRLSGQLEFKNISSQVSQESLINNITCISNPINDNEIKLHDRLDINGSQIYYSITYLTGNYSDYGLDSDGDGRFNYLVIDIEVNITEVREQYYLGLTLISEDQPSTIRIYRRIHRSRPEVGINTFSFHFDGSTFYLQRLNTSYRIDYIEFGYIGNKGATYYPINRIDSPYTTRVYNYSEFDPPPVILTRVYSDRGVDTDGDGRFNQLIIDMEVNVSDTGTYKFYLTLRSKSEREFYSEGVFRDLEKGVSTVSVPIDLFQVYILGESTSYNTSVTIRDLSYIQVFSASNVYETRVYNYTEFDLPSAFLAGNYNDYGVDLDTNGRFDQLVIDIEIIVTDAGEYQVEIILKPAGGLWGGTVKRSTRSYWTQGTWNVSVSIGAYRLYPNQLNTSYALSEVKIFNSQSILLSKSYMPYFTRIYNYTEFDIHRISIDGNDDFRALAKDENWFGNGTPLNPYIIEGLTLEGPDDPLSFAMISIMNTNMHFSINNCSIDGGGAGILLDGVKNAIISNNIIQNSYDGIFLRFSYNNTITGNTLNMNAYGIVIGDKGGTSPRYPNSVNNNTIINNVICNNVWGGILMGFDSSNNLIKWNDLNNNDIDSPFQATDYGTNNTFLSNYWGNATNNEVYLIPGSSAWNNDPDPLAEPHHLSRPTVLFPNWGGTFRNTIVIDWISAMDDLGHKITYSLYYSANNGSSWILLSSELTHTSFRWDVRNISVGSTFLVKIIATDSFGFFIMDISDQPFTIRPPLPPPSTLPFRLVIFLLLVSSLSLVIWKRDK